MPFSHQIWFKFCSNSLILNNYKVIRALNRYANLQTLYKHTVSLSIMLSVIQRLSH